MGSRNGRILGWIRSTYVNDTCCVVPLLMQGANMEMRGKRGLVRCTWEVRCAWEVRESR